MSVRFMDGFDESVPQAQEGYTLSVTRTTADLVSHPDGDLQLRIVNGDFQTNTKSWKAYRDIADNYGDRVGFGMLVNVLRNLAEDVGTKPWCVFLGIQTAAGQNILSMGRSTSGFVVINDVVTAFPFELSVYHFLELELDKVALVARAWMNNQLVGEVPLTGSEGALRYWFGVDAAAFGNGSTVPLAYFNDLYESDGQGAENNRRLGKVKVVTRLPLTDFATEFLRNGGTSNAGQVRTNDGDTSYVYTNQAGSVDLYANDDPLPFADAPVLAVSVTVSARKEGPDARSVVPMIQVDGADEVGARIDLQINNYRSGTAIFNVNPKTGQAWDNASAASAKFGQMLVI